MRSIFSIFIVMCFSVCPVTTLNCITHGRWQTGSDLTGQEAQQILDYHNKVRAEVGTPPLVWSAELAAYAQQWANELARKRCRVLTHRPRSGKWKQLYGENLFAGTADAYTVEDAAKEWYAEKRWFSNSRWMRAGHYSQMVWRSTTSMGCGRAVCSNGTMVVVVSYAPMGNILGQKAY